MNLRIILDGTGLDGVVSYSPRLNFPSSMIPVRILPMSVNSFFEETQKIPLTSRRDQGDNELKNMTKKNELKIENARYVALLHNTIRYIYSTPLSSHMIVPK